MIMNSTLPTIIACLLQTFPGPPSFKFEEAVIQLLPVSKLKCPDIDPVLDVTFETYSTNNPSESVTLRIGDDAGLVASGVDFSNPTMIFFHAFFEDSIAPTAQAIKQAFVQHGKYNLIFVDAARLIAGPWYPTAAGNTRAVGRYAALFVDYLVTRGLRLKSLHLVGLSLGAQMAGVCGHYIRSGRPGRITGLDPARPLFTTLPRSLRLDPSDAEFVDVIHTDAGVFGYATAIGHVDFWPNKGIAKQPGCNFADIQKRNPGSIFEPVFCSHWRSYQFFAESITKPHAFLSIKCNSWKEFLKEKCDETNIIPMGLSTPKYARGNYYLKTNPEFPYSQS